MATPAQAHPCQLALGGFGPYILVFRPGLNLKFEPINILAEFGLSDRKPEVWLDSVPTSRDGSLMTYLPEKSEKKVGFQPGQIN